MLALVLVLIAWTGLGLIPALIAHSQGSIAQAGGFGDAFGMINSLFTGLAFAAVLGALSIQRQDSLNAIHESTWIRLETAHRQLLATEVEARGALAVARATLASAATAPTHDAVATQKADESIMALEKLIADITRLRLTNAVDRSILGGDAIAARNFPGSDSEAD